MEQNNVKSYIKTRRKELGLTQTDLADLLNISFQTIRKEETGTSLPDSGVLLDLASVLDTSVDKIIHGRKK